MSTTTPAGQRELTPQEADQVDQVVKQINLIQEQCALRMALLTGRVIIDRVFGGKLPRAVGPRGAERVTYRQVAHHPALRMSHVKLWRMVRVTAQYEQLPEEVRVLGFSHQVALLPVSDITTRTALAIRAVEEDWTTDTLRQQVAQACPRLSRGRPRKPAFLRMADRMEHAVEALGDQLEFRVMFGGLNEAEIIDVIQRADASMKQLRNFIAEARRQLLARQRIERGPNLTH